jgi:putative transcriptional regulator
MVTSDFGSIEFMLDDVIQKSGLSKSKVAFKAEMQRTQLNAYIKGTIQRIDLIVLCRLCYALNCEFSDIIRYIPPKREVSGITPETTLRDARRDVARDIVRDATSLVADNADENSIAKEGLVEEEKA